MRKAATRLAVLLMAVLACAASADAAQHPKPRPARMASDLPAPSLPVTGASLLVAGSSAPLWSLHGDAELPIASTTKMMTALVVLQHVKNLTRSSRRPTGAPTPMTRRSGSFPASG